MVPARVALLNSVRDPSLKFLSDLEICRLPEHEMVMEQKNHVDWIVYIKRTSTYSDRIKGTFSSCAVEMEMLNLR